jgi:hypothetical protein
MCLQLPVSMYECKICGTEVINVKSYVEHCRIRANLPKLRLPCCFESCCKTTASFSGLRLHMIRHHTIRARQAQATLSCVDLNLRCNVMSCASTFSNTSQLVKHLQQHIREGMCVECPISSCSKRYRVRTSFASHLSRDHVQWTSDNLKADINCSLVTNEETLSEQAHGLVTEECGDEDDIENDMVSISKDQFATNLSLFFVKLSTQLLIPETSVQIIAEELLNISALNQMFIKESVVKALNSSSAGGDVVSIVEQAMDDNDVLKECLKDGGLLSTSSRRATHVKHNFNYVEPQSIFVGVSNKNKSRYCHYIPIKKSLTTLLNYSSVLKQCKAVRASNNGILADFTDGSVYKKNTADSSKKYLSLILFQDSFEVANPLGSAKKKHKVLGVYFVLGNLETYNRSNIDHTQLVLLALETDVSRIGNQIFKQLVDDLQELESDGIEVENEKFYVVLTAIAGDNLGSHWLGGFVTNFSSSSHMCRFCTLTKAELDGGCISEQSDRIRTPESYNSAVARLDSNDTGMIEGIKFQSLFNKLTHFHVCNPGLPPCVAHDLFEGVVAYDLALCLRHYVKLKLFTVKQLNDRIANISLSGSDANVRPAALSVGLDRLSGSASQNWCFLRILPLLLVGFVPAGEDDSVFEAIMLLRTIVEHVMAPTISVGQVAFMNTLIIDYVERRKILFPNNPLRPKHHYLTHYAFLTMSLGPLVRLWTMRFESKHQYFKRCVRNSRNFINVTGMLANRHQLLQAYLSVGIRFQSDCVVSDNAISVDFSSCPEIHKIIHTQESGVQIYSQIKLRGTLYRAGLALPLKVDNTCKTIEFGELMFILVGSNTQFLVKLRPSTYDFDLGGYVLAEGSSCNIQIALPDVFADLYPLSIYTVQGRSVVVLKHRLLDAC